MKRVVIYTRSASGTHHQMQEVALRRFAAERNWCVAANYQDVHVSGLLSGGGPAWQQLLADSGEVQPDILLVHNLDRISRSLSVFLRHIGELRERGICLVSVAENLDFSTPWGQCLTRILLGLSEITADKLDRKERIENADS